MAVIKMSEDSWFRWCCLKPNCLNSHKSRNFGFSSCIFWLISNMPVLHLALTWTLKGGKYNIEAEQVNGVGSCSLTSSLKLFTDLFQKQLILIFKDPVLLRLAACACVTARCAGRTAHGWVAGAGGRLSCSAPLLPGVAPVPILGRDGWNSRAQGVQSLIQLWLRRKRDGSWVSVTSCSTCFSQFPLRDY